MAGDGEIWNMVNQLMFGLVDESVEMVEVTRRKASEIQPKLEVKTEIDEMAKVCRKRIALVRCEVEPKSLPKFT